MRLAHSCSHRPYKPFLFKKNILLNNLITSLLATKRNLKLKKNKKNK
jgi:hypothetical protein